jgi:hypothetical protein
MQEELDMMRNAFEKKIALLKDQLKTQSIKFRCYFFYSASPCPHPFFNLLISYAFFLLAGIHFGS